MVHDDNQQTMDIDGFLEPLPEIKDPEIMERPKKEDMGGQEENQSESAVANSAAQAQAHPDKAEVRLNENEAETEAKRFAIINKPEILLETPYVVYTRTGQHMRYRLEFGYADQAIPEGEGSFMEDNTPPIETNEIPDNEALMESKREMDKKQKQKAVLAEVFSWARSILIAVIAALLIRSFVFVIVSVDGPSMRPTLVDNERLFVTRFDYILGNPKLQDIIICKYPNDYKNQNYVKRVIGTPGDTVEIKDGVVYVNGTALEEPYVKYPKRENYGPVTVPEKKYFVMGDNRADSRDSRSVGFIDEDKILGHARFVIYPFDKIQNVNKH